MISTDNNIKTLITKISDNIISKVYTFMYRLIKLAYLNVIVA